MKPKLPLKLTLDKLYQQRHSFAMQNTHNDKKPTGQVSGAVLAGGKSQRMHVDKATLTLRGESLFSLAVRALQTVCDDILIAGERHDLATEMIPCYPDRYPGSSLGGLYTALSNARKEWVCVLPCDLPFPSARLLQTLVGFREGESDAIIPSTPRGNEPLIGCYHKRVMPVIEQQLATGDLRLTRLLDSLAVRLIPPAELPAGWRRALCNLNSPSDLQRLNAPPPVLTFVAHSGTGKTTLVEKLIIELSRRGWSIGALKHDAHRFDIDHPGKDSWRLRQAGATVTAISSDEKSAFIQHHELPPTLEQILLPFQGQVDLVLTEGFKRSPLPKIEVYRKELDRRLICRGDVHDPTLLAFAGNTDLEQDVPTFPLDDPVPLSDFIEETFLQ